MFQYLFNDIIPSSVGSNAINKLKDQFHHIEFDDIHIFSENGLYNSVLANCAILDCATSLPMSPIK